MHAAARFAAAVALLGLCACAARPATPSTPTPTVMSETRPPLLGLRTALYSVPDLAQAREWYTRAVGHPPYFDEPFYVGFNVGGYELGLLPTGARGAGGVVAYWGVENADSALARLLQLGARENEGVEDVGGGIRVATVLDPFGNVFGIIENPHFKPE